MKVMVTSCQNWEKNWRNIITLIDVKLRFLPSYLDGLLHFPFNLMWFCFQDGDIHSYHISEFSEHLNTIDTHIKFTSEQEENNKIPFLDTCVYVQDDGSTKVTVYRKPTHTDQYLNFSSDHPLVHKRSVVRTLFHRADLITNEDDRQQEIEHVKNALRTNGYPEWMFKLPRKKPSEKETSERTISVSIPYIRGVSERLARSFKDHGVDMYHKPCNTLRSILVHPKDKTDKTMTCGAIYHAKCNDCDKEYIGESARTFETRWKEHKKRETSAIFQHCKDSGHHMDIENVTILETEPHQIKRKVKESIQIRRKKPQLNINEGYDIPPVFLPILTAGDHDLHGNQ